MAINLDERYPGRANPKTLSYPQGSFKNRTTPESKDGTYLEQDWANDWAGFFQWLLSKAGISPSGTPDTAEVSQYAQALQQLVMQWQEDNLGSAAYRDVGTQGNELMESSRVKQETGQSKTDVMSQKAVTDAL